MITKDEITKTQFKKFLKLRDSGLINMNQVTTGAGLSGLSVEVYKAIMQNFSYLYDKFNKYDMIEKYAQELEYIYIEYLLHASNLRFLKFNKLNNIKKVSIIMKEKYPNYRNNKYFKMENIKYRIVCNLFYKNKVKLLKLILK